ncbi:hypothetical protein [Pseudomonas entomophila]|uniref:DUF3630 family protein n=1 Tax=Pseudomonas entomophila TaxID=312306 RepID=A0ABY9QLC2_9PSED|nr:hypothetical protein [Pseudomonas entomophila]WMW03916.1 hypothetical protein RAH46_16425 [Pseudomonas entomophila]
MIDIDFSAKAGNITFNDFNIEESQPIESHIDDLKEDMLQVEFPGNLILDVGWRPSFSIKGKFHVMLIKNHDWENPVYHGTAKNIESLKAQITKAIQLT